MPLDDIDFIFKTSFMLRHPSLNEQKLVLCFIFIKVNTWNKKKKRKKTVSAKKGY